MSVSPLGTLLATRLDAVLGTTLAQHPTLLDIRANQAAQAMSAMHPQDNAIRRGPETAADVLARGARRTQGGVAGGERGAANPPGTGQPAASARTVLSEPAKAILALLVSRADVPPAIRGALPLLRLAAASIHHPPPGSRAAPPSTPGGATGTAAAMPAASNPAAAGAALPGNAPAKGALPAPHAQPNPVAPRMAGAAAPAATASGSSPNAIIGSASRAIAADGDAANPALGRATGTATPLAAGIGAGVTATAAAAPAKPVFSSTLAQALASALGRSVSESGLFYESHLSQLAFGQRRADSILREPQALLGRTLAAKANAGSDETSATRGTTPGRAEAATARTGDAALPVTTTAASTSGPVPGIHPDATVLVRQQLEVLAHSQFQWQGELWEGAPMEWEIGEQPGEDEAPGTWATRLRLELPHLGVVEARLSLAGSQLVMRVAAEHGAEPMQAAAATLRERLSGAGLVLSELAIHDGAASEPTPAPTP